MRPLPLCIVSAIACAAGACAPYYADDAGCSLDDRPGLAYCDFSGRDLRGQDLTGADLSHADLGGALLSDAVLVGARLSAAQLHRADLSGADLSGADLSDAWLHGANLEGANLEDVIWDETHCPDWTSSDEHGGSCEQHLERVWCERDGGCTTL